MDINFQAVGTTTFYRQLFDMRLITEVQIFYTDGLKFVRDCVV